MTRALAFASVFVLLLGISACKKSRPKDRVQPVAQPQAKPAPAATPQAKPAPAPKPAAATAKVHWMPKGHHTVTAALVVRGAAKAIEFYKKAFGAREIYRMKGPRGKSIMHAELLIGDSYIYLGDESPMEPAHVSPMSLGGKTSASLNLYVPDADAAFARAIAAGARKAFPVTNMFWGDRYGSVIDPFGHRWGISTHRENLTPAEIDARGKKWMAAMAKKMKGKMKDGKGKSH